MTAITYDVVDNSSFLDANAFQLATDQQFTDARAGSQTNALFASLYGATSVTAATGTDALINVALTLNRANDPTALLESSWAERQVALASQTEVWNTYGANPLTYQAVIDYITDSANGIGASALLTDAGYISSAQSRTIWLQLTPAQFESLFNTPLLEVKSDDGTFYAWAGNLSMPDAISASVRGLWVDENVSVGTPAVAAGVTAYAPQAGNQGIGNGGNEVTSTPAVIADAYNFPLDSSIATPAIALVEPTTQDPAALLAAINAYRAALNLPAVTAEQFQVLPGADPAGWTGFIDETALDISVVASAAPNSTQLLYSFVGQTHFTAYQQAVWDLLNNPGILTSSFPEDAEPTPNSLFYLAYSDLFTDAALRNMSVFLSSGDGGSQTEYGTGSPLLRTSHTVSTAIVVGGTSISTLASAQSDPTLATGVPATDLVAQVMSDTPNLDLLMAMTAAGLTTLPTNMVANSDPTQTDPLLRLFETTWNAYYISYNKHGEGTLDPSYSSNNSSSGGVDTTQSTPSYQTDYGLTPTSIGATVAVGRGAPDVSALASGNAYYYVLSSDYITDSSVSLTHGDGGTSAATPLWASLTAQFDAIFENQNLPQLGYYNDLLYMAAAIAPGAFNDISLGNNISTYYVATKDTPGAVLDENSGNYVVPTGLGFDAESGYDYTTGLGSPNGLLLARALTAIAHSQMYSDAPAVLGIVDATHGVSDASQTLLVQSQGLDGSFSLSAGGQSFTAQGGGSDLAWTSRLAQQSLQSDFDPDLVRIFDGVGQATPGSIHVANGATLSATSGTDALALYQAALTSAFGFAAFGTEDGAVTLARPVAIAETAGGANTQDVVVRIRQNGADETHLTFYKVDDLNGDIGGLAPGAAGYAEAAQARAYHTVDGQTSIDSPGWGNYAQTEIARVNAGDIIAMKLTNGANTFWAFAQANEQADGAGVTHLWSYGLNTWGWEDLAGGGDHDFNDLIVQLDFTSTSGDGWLI
ncbi:DUF4114 domain-containing protein [Xanthobacter sp. DSM 24535]|uniref:DUF4114 domain-containing protein n=1 Tax=Roseixanthobacter psychrophilus TaxID=3119917 RepID=UPI0037269321